MKFKNVEVGNLYINKETGETIKPIYKNITLELITFKSKEGWLFHVEPKKLRKLKACKEPKTEGYIALYKQPEGKITVGSFLTKTPEEIKLHANNKLHAIVKVNFEEGENL